jgi:pimeloyl-ACP methyl ester carboxylesterase
LAIDAARELSGRPVTKIVDKIDRHRRHFIGAAAVALATELGVVGALPVITVPTVTLDGEANGIIPASDSRSSAAKFSGKRIHHRVPNAGHALPRQAPKVFADAVMEVTKPV